MFSWKCGRLRLAYCSKRFSPLLSNNGLSSFPKVHHSTLDVIRKVIYITASHISIHARTSPQVVQEQTFEPNAVSEIVDDETKKKFPTTVNKFFFDHGMIRKNIGISAHLCLLKPRVEP